MDIYSDEERDDAIDEVEKKSAALYAYMASCGTDPGPTERQKLKASAEWLRRIVWQLENGIPY